jgi:hypothetical protein
MQCFALCGTSDVQHTTRNGHFSSSQQNEYVARHLCSGPCSSYETRVLPRPLPLTVQARPEIRQPQYAFRTDNPVNLTNPSLNHVNRVNPDFETCRRRTFGARLGRRQPNDQGPANLPRFYQLCYLEVDRGRHWNRIVGVRIRRPLFALNLRGHRTFRFPLSATKSLRVGRERSPVTDAEIVLLEVREQIRARRCRRRLKCTRLQLRRRGALPLEHP